MKACTVVIFAIQSNPTVVIIHDLGNDRKPQPDSIFLRSEKRIEDLLA